MPLPPGFCFITGFGPATRTLEKIAGALGQPIKVVALVHNHHGPATIDGMVGAEPELAARLQLGCNHVDRSRIHPAQLGMTRLGPGVGMATIDKAERPLGPPAPDVQRRTPTHAAVRPESTPDLQNGNTSGKKNIC